MLIGEGEHFLTPFFLMFHDEAHCGDRWPRNKR